MKFQIDILAKTIKTEQISLGELVDTLSKMLPDTWKEYKIICDSNYITVPMPDYMPKHTPNTNIPGFTPYTPSIPWYNPGTFVCSDTITTCWADQKTSILPHLFNVSIEKNTSQEVANKEEVVPD